MKRLKVLLLIGVVSFSICLGACGNNSGDANKDQTAVATPETEKENEEEKADEEAKRAEEEEKKKAEEEAKKKAEIKAVYEYREDQKPEHWDEMKDITGTAKD